MTTAAWSSPVDMASDATLRAWGSELNAKFAEVGLVQSADTGQVDWATITKQSVNAIIGYEIWQFDDALQSTYPIFFKIEYYMGSVNTGYPPMFYLTVGTGSNGSGTLTGQTSTRRLMSYPGNWTASTASWPSYLCHTEGFAGLIFKAATSGLQTGVFAFSITRSCDQTTGAINGKGFAVCMLNDSNGNGALPKYQYVRTQSVAATRTAHTSFVLPVGSVTDTRDAAGNYQKYRHFVDTPEVEAVFSMCSYYKDEHSSGSTFTVALVGSSARTFIGVSPGFTSTGATNYQIAMLYE